MDKLQKKHPLFLIFPIFYVNTYSNYLYPKYDVDKFERTIYGKKRYSDYLGNKIMGYVEPP